MERYKVYQLQRINEVITHDEITDNDISEYDVKLNVIAEYTTNKQPDDNYYLAEEIWDSCNVDCWDNEWIEGSPVSKENTITYPTEYFNGFCNSDIVVETSEGLYLAESFGFKKVESLDEAIYRIIYRYDFINWKDIRNKSDFDIEKLNNIIKIIKEERKNKK